MKGKNFIFSYIFHIKILDINPKYEDDNVLEWKLILKHEFYFKNVFNPIKFIKYR